MLLAVARAFRSPVVVQALLLPAAALALRTSMKSVAPGSGPKVDSSAMMTKINLRGNYSIFVDFTLFQQVYCYNSFMAAVSFRRQFYLFSCCFSAFNSVAPCCFVM
jgi:hypothetical protein